MASVNGIPARATVIIPTYGKAPFVRWAIASAQAQTVTELEICVICDGSPSEMVDLVRDIAAEDNRVRVFVYPKAPRTGEIHRARVIAETTGAVVCYLSHDDLWFPSHVEILEHLLRSSDFGHTMHVCAGLGADMGAVRSVMLADLADPYFRRRITSVEFPINYFGLSYGAHTREAYSRLEEGWTTSPDNVTTDLYMWRKFTSAPWCRCASHMGVTALHFERSYWDELYSTEAFSEELGRCYARMIQPGCRDIVQSRATCQVISQMPHPDPAAMKNAPLVARACRCLVRQIRARLPATWTAH